MIIEVTIKKKKFEIDKYTHAYDGSAQTICTFFFIHNVIHNQCFISVQLVDYSQHKVRTNKR